MYRKSILEINKMLSEGEINSEELCRYYLKRVEELDDKLNAFLYVNPEQVIEQARAIDERIKREGTWSLITGIPIAIKDNICTEGMPTTCASRILKNFYPPYDATAVKRLKEAGAVIIGKTNLDEFAMGSSTENSAFKKTKNPWNLEYVPGGSSGGSASAVSSRMVLAALGSDTGGSVRQPAALCGVVGMKPTYGRISRYGLVAFASSLDVIGIFTTRILDNAILLSIIAGADDFDNTSSDLPPDNYVEKAKENISGIKIGIPKEYFVEGTQKEITDKIFEALKILEKKGAILKEISMPFTEYAIACYYIICTAEASSNLARYDGVKYGLRIKDEKLNYMYKKTRSAGFGEEVKRRIMLGTFALSAGYYDAYYLKAAKVRNCIANDFRKAFEEVDAIASPTSPTTSWRFGEKLDDPLKMYLSDIFTVTTNLAGIPAISIPCGFDSLNLPIGLQLMSNHFNESILYKISYAYENETKFFELMPSLGRN